MITVPTKVLCCIVDAMHVVRMIPPTFLEWTKRLYNHMKQLYKYHIVLPKARETKSKVRKIADSSQQVPKVSEWTDFLTNSENKCRLMLLLADFFLIKSKYMEKDVYVTKGNQYYHSTIDAPITEKQTQESIYKLFLLHRITNQVQFVLLKMIRMYISRCIVVLYCISIVLEKCTFDKVQGSSNDEIPTMIIIY